MSSASNSIAIWSLITCPVILLENRAGQVGKFCPDVLPEERIAGCTEHDFRFGVEVGKIPIRIDGKESVAGFLQNIGHPPRRFLESGPGVIPFLESLNLAFRDREAHAQTAGVERFGEIIVRASSERLLEILGIGPRGHEQDIHLVAIWACAQVAAKLDPAFAGQHPVENQKRERLPFGELRLRFLRAGAGNHFVAALLDETTQVAPAIGVVLDQKNSHGLRKNCLHSTDHLGRPLRHPKMGEWLACVLRCSRMTASRMGRFGKFSLPDGALWTFIQDGRSLALTCCSARYSPT